MTKFFWAILVVLVLGSIGFAFATREKEGSKTESPSSTSSTTTESTEKPANTPVINEEKKSMNPEATIFVKGYGQISLELYASDAPKTVKNFVELAKKGYYNGVTFHRVSKGFVIQGGDPTGTGGGGESIYGEKFEDELNPETESYKAGYKKGVLAMANSGPNTNGSQFFIMLADAQLPHNYTIFGRVTAGQDVVDKIGTVEIVPQMGPTDGKPKNPVVMEKVEVAPAK